MIPSNIANYIAITIHYAICVFQYVNHAAPNVGVNWIDDLQF